MKSHSIPSLLGIAAVLIAALVVAIAFGVATDSHTAQAASHDDPTLINITTAAQLNAVRYDNDGDGEAETGDADGRTAYEEAFSLVLNASACPDGGCVGYELMADLDLAKDYGAPDGWTPISTFSGTFDGNGKTISNLFIDSTDSGDVGLFATLGSEGVIENLSVTGTVTAKVTGDATVGGLVGRNSGTIATSTHAAVDVSVQASGTINAGGLVGFNAEFATVRGSYATGHVSASTSTGFVNMVSTVGGLVGDNGGTIAASYATGDVDAASGSATIRGVARAGGLVGSSSGDITASYATGDVTATAAGASGSATAGGLVGNASSGDITASYSTGMPAATGADLATNAGGLVGAVNDTVNVNNSYFDMMSSKTATTTDDDPGKTTLELQTPRSTSTPADNIYATWDVNIDDTDGGDAPWDFGEPWQYPVLQYGALKDVQQRAQVTLVLTPATISEKRGKTTVTATQDREANLDTVLTVSVNSESVALSPNTTLTIKAGETTSETSEGTVTITAVDNNDVADSATSTVAVSATVGQGGSGADNDEDGATLTITDDESLEPDLVENVRIRAKATLAVVSWDELDGAEGYTIQWTSRASRGVANWDRASEQETSRTSTTVRRLSPGTEYHFRVRASNMENSWSTADGSETDKKSKASTEGDEDDAVSPFATMTPTPTATPAAPPATPIPPTSMVSSSTAATLRSGDGSVTLEFPAGSRSDSYQVNFESETGCTYPGAKADVTFTCVSVLIFDSEDMLETGVELDAPATITFRLTAEQVKALGGEFLLTKLHEMGGLMILTRASAGAGWTPLSGTTLTFDDETGGAVLAGWTTSFSSFTAVADQATYDTIQEMYGHLLPRDTLTPPTGGPSLPGVALLALLLGSVALLTTGWVMTARRSGA